MKILVVLPRFPYPLEKGDKLRAYNQIKYLSKNNDVYLFCVSHQKVTQSQLDALAPFCKDMCVVKSPRLVNYLNVVRNYFYAKSLQIGYWDSKRARKGFKKFQQKVQPDVIYSQMVRTMTWVSHSTLPKVMDFQDALSMNTERRMDLAHGLWHYILHFEFKMLRSSEYNAFKIFDALTIISDVDSEAIPHRKNSEIKVLPNGVDFQYFSPMIKQPQYDIVFCGNMSYLPNVNACSFLVEKVMPIVWKQIPAARVLIAGATPCAKVMRYNSDKVKVAGWVEDIRECYASAKLLAAPMQIGSGLQNKLLEAMAMQIPCVATSIANNSLHAQNGKDILISDDADGFAQHIVSLLNDETLRHNVAMSGYDFVKENYSWESSVEKLENILRVASADKSPRLN